VVTDNQTAILTTRLHEKQRAQWSRYGFENLLAWLFLLLLMVRLFLAKTPYAEVVFSGFLSLVLLSAAFSSTGAFILIGQIGSTEHEPVLSAIGLTVLLSVFLHGLSAVPLSTLRGRYANRHNLG
jgi:hypothetical protein